MQQNKKTPNKQQLSEIQTASMITTPQTLTRPYDPSLAQTTSRDPLLSSDRAKLKVVRPPVSHQSVSLQLQRRMDDSACLNDEFILERARPLSQKEQEHLRNMDPRFMKYVAQMNPSSTFHRPQAWVPCSVKEMNLQRLKEGGNGNSNGSKEEVEQLMNQNQKNIQNLGDLKNQRSNEIEIEKCLNLRKGTNTESDQNFDQNRIKFKSSPVVNKQNKGLLTKFYHLDIHPQVAQRTNSNINTNRNSTDSNAVINSEYDLELSNNRFINRGQSIGTSKYTLNSKEQSSDKQDLIGLNYQIKQPNAEQDDQKDQNSEKSLEKQDKQEKQENKKSFIELKNQATMKQKEDELMQNFELAQRDYPKKSILKKKATNKNLVSQSSQRSVSFNHRRMVRKFNPNTKIKLQGANKNLKSLLSLDHPQPAQVLQSPVNVSPKKTHVRNVKQSNPSMFMLSHRTINHSALAPNQ